MSPTRTWGKQYPANKRGRQMMAIADHAGPEFIGSELFPQIILVARQDCVRAVAQVGAETRPGGDRFVNSRRQSRRVANRYHDSGRRQSFDECE